MTTRDLVAQMYSTFNRRDIDAALAMMGEQVDWPMASEGGRVVGKEEIRAYWTRQWAEFDPHVEPVEINDRFQGNNDRAQGNNDRAQGNNDRTQGNNDRTQGNSECASGKVEVKVHQVVKDLQGSLLADQMVVHIYTVADGLIQRMDIENAGESAFNRAKAK